MNLFKVSCYIIMKILLRFFPFIFLLAPCLLSSSSAAVKIGFIVDANTTLGRTSSLCVNMSAADFYASRPNSTTTTAAELVVIAARDSGGDIVGAAAAAFDLIQNGQVDAIIGPQTSGEASFVAELGTKANVPVVSFSATSPAVSPSETPFFVRAAPGDAAQSAAVAALVDAFGWRRLVPIYEDNDGYGGAAFVSSLVDALDAVGVAVPYRADVPALASDDLIAAELYNLKTLQTRVFLVHASAPLAVRIFAAADAAGMMSEGYAWIATNEITSQIGTAAINASTVLSSLQGVLGVRAYIPDSSRLRDFRRRWRREFRREYPDMEDHPTELSSFGIWAYDAVWAVVTAIEAALPTSDTNSSRSPNATVDFGEFPDVIRARSSGRKLLDSILGANFDGLGGEFRLVGGELNLPAFEVVNVVGEKGRRIGFWTANSGLSKNLSGGGGNGVGGGGYSASKASIGAVVWPGDVTAAPKGWQTPTSGAKLRIAVPAVSDFKSFVSVDRDPASNETVAAGFVIDVFEAAVAQLPYALPFTYSVYNAGDYNQLAYDMYLQKYDAVVADMTITANRMQYASFTTPYTITGISMVVPVRTEKGSTTWVFLKPWNLNLWLAAGAFLILTGLVVYVLEHRVNPEFRGPPANQLGAVLYFAFSTLVFSHNENIASNLGRVVVVTWVFVVLILQSSYTASLASMLTVQQLQPVWTSLAELNASKEYIGYLKGSFVHGFLLNMGFNASRLKPYTSPEQYAAALAMGTGNGGISAIVDEVPYLSNFLKGYCSNYTMSGDIYKTGGFGFAFPKGSRMADDLTAAILKITESGQMSDIETRWLGDQNSCQNQGSTISSNSLDFKSFSGLFLITGGVLVFAFCTYWACFFFKHRNHLKDLWAVESPLSRRVRSIAEFFDQKDISSHTFRQTETRQSMKETPSPSMPKDLQSQRSSGSYTHEEA